MWNFLLYDFPHAKRGQFKRESAYLRLGTSSFTAEGWEKTFYPKGMQARDYLSYYATQFDTLEMDATFYRIPAESTVKGWYAKTPASFLFALKAPQEITHERVLVDAEPIMKEFLRATELSWRKRWPILFQFQYFNKKAFPTAGGIPGATEDISRKAFPRSHVLPWKFATKPG